ncbi:hypothetical protein KD5_41390 (plasmid) [Yersinia pseudotuberculosis]|nr:hypothetical protein YP72344_41950 [Yersinia pseudotuberculosis]
MPKSLNAAKWVSIARIMAEGTAYEVEPDSVLLLWGLFDNELHVEFEGEWTGPYYPISGPTLLNVV